MHKSLLRILILTLTIASAVSSDSRDQPPSDAQSSPNFPESPAGFNAQFSAIVRAYQAGNKALGEQLVDQFRLPQREKWFTENISAEQSRVLAERYDRLFPAFAAELETNIRDAVDNQLKFVAELKDGTEDPLPKGIRSVPLSGITTIKKTPLFYASFDRQRNGNSTGSWARAFIYEDVAFRFIGFGSKPFWIWENDSTFIGPPPTKPLQLAKVIHQVPASYPASALAKGIAGRVALKLSIDTQGRVTDATVLSGDPALTKAAIDAARQWRFEAPIREGSPIESLYIAEFNFAKP
jgi:TonB family protein